MLPVIKTRETEFHSAGAALAYLEGRAVQHFTVPLHDLRVDTSGVIHHTGPAPIEQLRGVPLTDTALSHLDTLAGIPASYASHIEPDLHEHSLNELLERQLAAVTVVAECDRKEPESRHVVAVLPGSRPGIDDSIILQRIEAHGVGASISLRTGQMEVRFGSPSALEVLPGDELQVTGLLRNERWQFLKVSTTPTLEVGVYLLRLVCSNGAYARRVLAESRLMAWATRKEVDLFLDHQLTRILSFEATVLKSAAATMNESIPNEPERAHIQSLLTRFVGAKRAGALLEPTVSWWDHSARPLDSQTVARCRGENAIAMSLYRIIEQPSGFCVERLSRERLTVQLEPRALWLTQEGQPAERCTFYDGDRLPVLIAMKLLGEDDAAFDETDRPGLSRAIREARTIRTDVGLQRLRLLAQVDPAVHQIQLIALRIAGRVPSLAQEAALFREPYILKDILTYRAAAIAFAFLRSKLWRSPLGVEEGIENLSSSSMAEDSEPPVAELLEAMAHWRGLFSPDGKSYRTLDRTLMNLPPDVPPELVCQLRHIRLERPVLNWIEFTTLMRYVQLRTAWVLPWEPELDRSRVFQHATADEIEGAVSRIAVDTNRDLDLRRPDDVHFVIRYLCSYPEPFDGRLCGLADRAIRWHRQVRRREHLEELARDLGGADRPARSPAISLPEVGGIRFLATVGEIVEEGLAMKHCIATRAPDAIKGRCFLFHIDHGGQRASVELSPRGEIIDAEGPHNSKNEAVSWGVMQLRQWAVGLQARVVERKRPRRPKTNPNQLSLFVE